MIRINLLPHAKLERLKIEINRQLIVIGLALVLVMAVCAGLWWFQHQKLGQLRWDMSQADKEIKRLEKVIARDVELRRFRKDIGIKLSTIIELKRNQMGPVHTLDELAKSLSDQLWLTDFTDKDGKITLRGSAFSNVSIANFMRNLEESPYFQNVELAGTSLNKSDRRSIYGFTINCQRESPPTPESEEVG